MEVAEGFLKRSKRRMYRGENFQPHTFPRLNLHVVSNSLAANNVLEQILTSMQPERTAHVSSYPIPIGPPVNIDDFIVKGLDPALKLVNDKRQFKAVLESLRHSKEIKELSVDDIEQLSEMAQNEPAIDVHPNVLTYAQVFSLDPDPFFSCDYNYYYGGNVAVTEVQGRAVVIHIEKDKPSQLRVLVPDFDEESSFEVSHVNHLMEENSVIYQVDCLSDLTLLRQKRACGLFKINLDEGARLFKMGIVTTPDVFVSSCSNPFKQDEFATVSAGPTIEVHDVQSKSKRSVDPEIEGAKDQWGHVHYHDQNVLMFANRDSVCLCDLRESGPESLLWEVRNQTEKCDDVFAAVKGKFLHYICTKHYLLSLDIRKGFHQRWAHGLPAAPSLLHVVPNETRHDGLVMGCQSSGSMAYVQNSCFGDFTSDIVLPPVRLPSPRETLHLARTKGCLLSPIISSRFSLSLTGLASFKHTRKIQILSCNSVGDLFAQSIDPNSQNDTLVEPLTASDLERLWHWESQCLQHFSGVNHDFKATWVVPLKHLAGMFDHTLEATKDEPSTSQQVTSSFQPWNKSKKRLLSFQDVLAQRLLPHWNIEEDDEWCDVDAGETINVSTMGDEESSDEQEDVETRVQKWLDKSAGQSFSNSTGTLSDSQIKDGE